MGTLNKPTAAAAPAAPADPAAPVDPAAAAAAAEALAQPDAQAKSGAETKKDGAVAKPEDKIPIMGHPPEDTSDLSLDDFLNRVADHNAKHVNSTKGVKLDFKSIEAVEKSIDLVKKDVRTTLLIIQ